MAETTPSHRKEQHMFGEKTSRAQKKKCSRGCSISVNATYARSKDIAIGSFGELAATTPRHRREQYMFGEKTGRAQKKKCSRGCSISVNATYARSKDIAIGSFGEPPPQLKS